LIAVSNVLSLTRYMRDSTVMIKVVISGEKSGEKESDLESEVGLRLFRECFLGDCRWSEAC
jgi:hypothetical protein